MLKTVFSRGDSTNYSYNLYTITEVLQNTLPNYKLNYLAERYNQNLLHPRKLTPEQNKQVRKELNLFH